MVDILRLEWEILSILSVMTKWTKDSWTPFTVQVQIVKYFLINSNKGSGYEVPPMKFLEQFSVIRQFFIADFSWKACILLSGKYLDIVKCDYVLPFLRYSGSFWDMKLQKTALVQFFWMRLYIELIPSFADCKNIRT